MHRGEVGSTIGSSTSSSVILPIVGQGQLAELGRQALRKVRRMGEISPSGQSVPKSQCHSSLFSWIPSPELLDQWNLSAWVGLFHKDETVPQVTRIHCIQGFKGNNKHLELPQKQTGSQCSSWKRG